MLRAQAWGILLHDVEQSCGLSVKAVLELELFWTIYN